MRKFVSTVMFAAVAGGCASSGSSSRPATLTATTSQPARTIRGVPTIQSPATHDVLIREVSRKPGKAGDSITRIEWPATIGVTTLADGYRVVWHRGAVQIVDCALPGSSKSMQATVLAMARASSGPILSALDDTTFDMRFDREWHYVGLFDLESPTRAAERTVKATNAMRVGRGVPALAPNIVALMTSRNAIERVMPQEALLYFLGERAIIGRQGGDVIDASAPSPLGGVDVPVRQQATLDGRRDDQVRLVLRVASTMQAGDVAHTIQTTPGAAPVSEADHRQLAAVQLAGTAEFHIDPSTGWPSYAKSTLPSTAGQKQVTFEWITR